MMLSVHIQASSVLRGGFVLMTLLLAAPQAGAQVCEGFIVLKTQADVDAFDCTEVQGSLYIGHRYDGSSDYITSLGGLSELTTVRDDLEIKGNLALTSLSGLEALEAVGNRIWMQGNHALTSVEALGALTSFRFLHVENHDSLESMDGLDALSSAHGITLYNNDALTDIGSFESLADLSGLTISLNDKLVTLDGFDNLGTLWRLDLFGNDSLEDITGLKAAGLGDISISHNRRLVTIEGLALSGVRDLNISYNAALRGLANLDSSTQLPSLQYLYVIGNRSLTDLRGLGDLGSSPLKMVYIWENPSLESLDGLQTITAAQDIFVRSNAVGTYTPDSDHVLRRNAGLIITVVGNVMLTTLDGLNGITEVTNSISISGNLITDIDALAGLSTVGGNLNLAYNPALANVDGLANLTSVGERLWVGHNEALSACTTGLGSLLENGGAGGPVWILDNAPGCNSKWEAMGFGVDAEGDPDSDKATPLVTGLAAPYPNPTAGAATVAFTLAEAVDVTLTVYDALGRRVAVLAEGAHPAGVHEAALDAALPAGTYVVRFAAGGQARTERVTVVR